MCVLSCVWLFATPWTVTSQAPLSMEFSRQEYWSGLPFLPPRDLPIPGIEPMSLTSSALTVRFFTPRIAPRGKPHRKNISWKVPWWRLWNMVKVRHESCPFDLTTWRSLKTMSEQFGCRVRGDIGNQKRERKRRKWRLGVFKMYFKTFIYGWKQMVLDPYVYMYVCVSMFINN